MSQQSVRPVMDAFGKELLLEDCVEVNGDIYAVMGLMDFCGEDAIILGDVMGGQIEYPYIWPANDLMRVDLE